MRVTALLLGSSHPRWGMVNLIVKPVGESSVYSAVVYVDERHVPQIDSIITLIGNVQLTPLGEQALLTLYLYKYIRDSIHITTPGRR